METINQLIKILNSLNPTLMVGLLSAFVALFVLSMTNAANNRRLDKQFDNDRKIKAKDREMNLRKEIFLEATTVMAVGVNTLIKFTNLDLSDSEVIKDYVEKSPALVKLNLIANMDTLAAVANFSTELSSLFLKYYAKRSLLIHDNNLISMWKKEILKLQSETSNLLELMKQYNIEGNTDTRKWDMYQKNYAFADSTRAKCVDKIDKISNDLEPKRIDLIRECMHDIESLAGFQLSILKAARKELELDFDEDQFTNILTEAIRKNQIALNTYLKLE